MCELVRSGENTRIDGCNVTCFTSILQLRCSFLFALEVPDESSQRGFASRSRRPSSGWPPLAETSCEGGCSAARCSSSLHLPRRVRWRQRRRRRRVGCREVRHQRGQRRRPGVRPAKSTWPRPTWPRVRHQGQDVNAVDHNTFQENINTYLQGNPDDVFTWFAGFRMNQFAEQGLITDLSDVWPIDGVERQLQAGLHRDRRQAVLRAASSYYPWAVFYQKSVFEKNGYAPPDDARRAHRPDARRCRATTSRRSPSPTRTAGPRWAPSTSSTCASTASTST